MNYLDEFKEHTAPFCKALDNLGNWLNDNRYKGVPNEITEQYLDALLKVGILTLEYTQIVKLEVKAEEMKAEGATV